jgi:3-carboxy-cis,cis-muconate cycloisomerase
MTARADCLFAGLFSRGAVAAQVSDRAFLQAMLDVEVALARALSAAGMTPPSAGDEIAAVADARDFDLAELGRSTADKGTPVPALVAALRDRVPDAAAAHVHQGATSQDIVDTAAMLVCKRALGPLLDDLRLAADACAQLADTYRHALEPGRTLMQQAPPITFGLKAAGWLSALDAVREQLAEVRAEVPAVQLGGAVGTLAAFGGGGLEIATDVADQLGLIDPGIPWHTDRLRPARVACVLGMALGVLAKLARDVVLLAQTEVAEVREGEREDGAGGRGGSSTMPHKRNPVGAIAVLACAQRGPGLVATVLSAMAPELERGAGSWQAEWAPLAELLRLAGSAAASARELLDGLEVDTAKMGANLELGGDFLMSESVAVSLGALIGRPRAQELVEAAARRAVREHRPLREELASVRELADVLGSEGLEHALDPAAYLGVTARLIDRALSAHGALAEL